MNVKQEISDGFQPPASKLEYPATSHANPDALILGVREMNLGSHLLLERGYSTFSPGFLLSKKPAAL
jgi:hypothetical protein